MSKQDNFKKELSNLFKKYGAEMELAEERKSNPYGCGTYTIDIYLDGYEDYINLGSYYDGNL